MPSRRQVLRTAGVASGFIFAGQTAAARNLDGERIDVQQAEKPVITVDRQVTDDVPDGPRTSVKDRYPFIEGGDGTVYVSESDDKPAFNPYDEVVVAESTNRIKSTDAGNRVSLTDGPQSFHSAAGGVVGEMEPTIALDTTERPAAGIRVVGDGVSVAVRPGDSETVEVTGPFRLSGETTATGSATVEVTVEHRGVRELIAHPTAKLRPEDHRLGRLVAREYDRAGSDGVVSTEQLTLSVDYDERGFFAHEKNEERPVLAGESKQKSLQDLEESVSSESYTTAGVIGTREYGSVPSGDGDRFDQLFNEQTDHEVSILELTDQADLAASASSGGITDLATAIDAVAANPTVNFATGLVDALIVVDDRSIRGDGISKIGTAGDFNGFGYVASPNSDNTVAHEFGHIYGASHQGPSSDWERTGYFDQYHTLMGYNGVDPSCYDREIGMSRVPTLSGCTVDKINSYVNSNL